MNPLVHGLLGWLIAFIFLKRSKDRRLALIPAVAPDIDGIFVLFSHDMHMTWHHTFGHTYLFGLPMALAAAALCKDKKRGFLAAILAFTSHLGMDIIGSNWVIHPFWPYEGIGFTAATVLPNFIIYDVINVSVIVILLATAYLVTYRCEVSPFEFLGQKANSLMVGLYVYPFKHKCQYCGKRAWLACRGCGKKICPEHTGNVLGQRCKKCLSARNRDIRES